MFRSLVIEGLLLFSLAVGLRLLRLLLSPVLRHTSEPVQEECADNVEGNVDEEKAEVAPAVL